LDPTERFVQSFEPHRLGQIVECLHFEGLRSMLVVGGDEHDLGTIRPASGQQVHHVKAIEHGHLHVQKHGVDLMLVNQRSRLFSTVGLAEQSAEAFAG
jgi:hypothetical protein